VIETARLVRRMLRESRWSKSWLARRIGVTPGAVTHWVRGRNEPSLRTLRKIGKALGYTVCLTVAPTGTRATRDKGAFK
jgi:transcriptional regulator with XRE-family HTH domain